MNKLLTKIVGAALGVAMTVGVGVAVATNANKGFEPAYAAATGNRTSSVSFTSSNTSGTDAQSVTWNTDTSSGGVSSGSFMGMYGGAFIKNNTAIKVNTNQVATMKINMRKYGGPSSAQATVKAQAFNSSGTAISNQVSLEATTTGNVAYGSDNNITFTSQNTSTDVFFRFTSASSATSSKYVGVYSITVIYTAAPEKLATPSPTYDDDTKSVSWEAVANASSYQVKVDSGSYATATSPYDVSGLSTGAQHTVYVIAKTDSASYSDSDAGSVSFTPTAPKTVSNFSLLGGVSSGDVIKMTAEEGDESIVGTPVYYLLKFTDNSYGAAALSWSTMNGIDNVDHFTNADSGSDDGGYVEPTFTRNGTYTLTLSYPGQSSLSISWKIKGLPTISYVNDTLTPTNILNPSSYEAWSGKDNTITGINSDAVYSGFSTGGNAKIQMRTDDSGIYTTVSGGKIHKVTIVWNSSTVNDRHVLIYGKNTAFSSISDITGDALGNLNSTNDDTEYTFTADYNHVGIRVSGGALYLDSITFTWAIEDPSTDVLKSISISNDPSTTTYYAGQTISPEGLVVTATFEDDEQQESQKVVTGDVEWTISYPTALAEDEGKVKSVTFEASYTSNEVTKTDSVSKNINVSADSVTALGWGNRGSVNVFSGTTLGDAVDTTAWTFTPTWASGKSDSPTWGTGDNNVHVALYDTSTPASESETKLTASYELQGSDNGKYLVAFYKGTRTNNNSAVSVTKWRSVIEDTGTTTGTFDFSSGTAKGTGFTTTTFGDRYSNAGGLAKPTISNLNALYDGNGSGGAIQGTGFARIGKNGSVTLTFATGTLISSITMGLQSWAETENATISVTNCDSYTTVYSSTGQYTSHTFTLSTATNAITISTDNARAFINQITITATGEQEIGKTADCLGLETFIDNNLHMDDYTTSQGWCKDSEHHYYSTAKAAYNSLNAHQKSLFVGNSAYAQEYARLSAWAEANGEAFNASTHVLETNTGIAFINNDSSSVAVIVIIVSVISLSAVAGFFLLRKRKEQ